MAAAARADRKLSLGALLDGVLRELAGKREADHDLDLAGGEEARLLGGAAELGRRERATRSKMSSMQEVMIATPLESGVSGCTCLSTP